MSALGVRIGWLCPERWASRNISAKSARPAPTGAKAGDHRRANPSKPAGSATRALFPGWFVPRSMANSRPPPRGEWEGARPKSLSHTARRLVAEAVAPARRGVLGVGDSWTMLMRGNKHLAGQLVWSSAATQAVHDHRDGANRPCGCQAAASDVCCDHSWACHSLRRHVAEPRVREACRSRAARGRAALPPRRFRA